MINDGQSTDPNNVEFQHKFTNESRVGQLLYGFIQKLGKDLIKHVDSGPWCGLIFDPGTVIDLNYFSF